MAHRELISLGNPGKRVYSFEGILLCCIHRSLSCKWEMDIYISKMVHVKFVAHLSSLWAAVAYLFSHTCSVCIYFQTANIHNRLPMYAYAQRTLYAKAERQHAVARELVDAANPAALDTLGLQVRQVVLPPLNTTHMPRLIRWYKTHSTSGYSTSMGNKSSGNRTRRTNMAIRTDKQTYGKRYTGMA